MVDVVLLMLVGAVAVLCVARTVVLVRVGRSIDGLHDAAHLVMCLGMAAMVVPALALGLSAWWWGVVFTCTAVLALTHLALAHRAPARPRPGHEPGAPGAPGVVDTSGSVLGGLAMALMAFGLTGPVSGLFGTGTGTGTAHDHSTMSGMSGTDMSGMAGMTGTAGMHAAGSTGAAATVAGAVAFVFALALALVTLRGLHRVVVHLGLGDPPDPVAPAAAVHGATPRPVAWYVLHPAVTNLCTALMSTAMAVMLLAA